MPILARYLFRQFLPAFALALAVCGWVLLMNHFLKLFNLAVLKGISPAWILWCFGQLSPMLFSMAAPIAFLVALLLTLGKLSETGEVLALRASGFSFREILWPYFVGAAVLSAGLLFVNHRASPEGFHAFRMAEEAALRQVSRLDLEPGAFSSFGDWRMVARDFDRRRGRLGGIYLVKVSGEHNGVRVEAPEGRVSLERGLGLWIELDRGSLFMPGADPSGFVHATFESSRLFVPAAPPETTARDLDMQELATARLRELLRGPSLDDGKRREYRTEAALRSAAALTPLVFFWLGCPLGLILEKHARATGFVLALAVMLGFYALLAVGIGLGRRHGALSPVGPWLPVAGGLAAAAGLWRRNLAR